MSQLPRTQSGADALAEATGVAGYDALADGIKADLSLHEWRWLSDSEKARLVQSYCEPDVFEDGS